MSAMARDPMLPELFRVQRVKLEIPGTFTMELEPVDGGAVPAFVTGQFNMLYVFGVGEIPISISGDPDKRTPLVHTTRAAGTVSSSMQELKPGDTIGVRGPFGSHWPIEQASGKDVVIVAGGIGLAPLRSAMYQIISRREQYGKVSLLYGARTPPDILYRHELERWRSRLDLDVYITVDRADESWRGSVAVVTQPVRRAAFDPSNTLALVCGPEIMMRYTAAELAKYGLPAESIYVSLERNMKCAVGLCGHCQYGPHFVCKDGPVFQYSCIEHLLVKGEI